MKKKTESPIWMRDLWKRLLDSFLQMGYRSIMIVFFERFSAAKRSVS